MLLLDLYAIYLEVILTIQEIYTDIRISNEAISEEKNIKNW